MSEQIYDAKAERAAIDYIQGQKVCLPGEGKAMKQDIETGQEDEWNPLHDDGDSRRLENACFRWMAEHEGKHDDLPKRVVSERSHVAEVRDYGTDEFVRAAVFALAVAIGKTMEGNDNAG
jgi:hypothetical protein